MTRQEKIKKYDIMLRKYIDNKEFVKIRRTVYEKEETLSGFILSMSKQFLLMQITYDFMLDGFTIFRKDDFDSIRCNKYEKTQKKIFKAEGLMETGYGLDKIIPLTGWKEILTALKRYDYHVEVENINKDNLDFTIGQIINVSDKSVSIHYYDPTGMLDKTPMRIKFDTISIVTFGDMYSTIFRKYLRANN